MKTTLHVNEFNKFRKPKNKKWLICSHSFEKHLNYQLNELKYQNHDLQETWVLMKI